MKPSIDVYSGGPATNEYITAINNAIILGRKIQFRPKRCEHILWNDLLLDKNNSLVLNWVQYDFRVNPSDRPKKIVPLEISDLGPVTWFRGPGIIGEQMVISICRDGLSVMMCGLNGCAQSITSIKLSDFFTYDGDRANVPNTGTHEYSTDRKIWKSTQKEVDAE